MPATPLSAVASSGTLVMLRASSLVVSPSAVVDEVESVESSPPEKTPAMARTATIRITPTPPIRAIRRVCTGSRRVAEGVLGTVAASVAAPEAVTGVVVADAGAAGCCAAGSSGSPGAGIAARRRLPRGSGRVGSLAAGASSRSAASSRLRQLVGGRILLDEADRVGTADRIGLAEEIVGEADLGVGIGAPESWSEPRGP